MGSFFTRVRHAVSLREAAERFVGNRVCTLAQGIPANSVLLHEVRPNGVNHLALTSPRGTGEWRTGETFTVPIGVETGTGSIYVTVTRSLAPERWVPIGLSIRLAHCSAGLCPRPSSAPPLSSSPSTGLP